MGVVKAAGRVAPMDCHRHHHPRVTASRLVGGGVAVHDHDAIRPYEAFRVRRSATELVVTIDSSQSRSTGKVAARVPAAQEERHRLAARREPERKAGCGDDSGRRNLERHRKAGLGEPARSQPDDRGWHGRIVKTPAEKPGAEAGCARASRASRAAATPTGLEPAAEPKAEAPGLRPAGPPRAQGRGDTHGTRARSRAKGGGAGPEASRATTRAGPRRHPRDSSPEPSRRRRRRA